MKLPRAVTTFRQGNMLRAVEEALPTGFANFIKATTRYAPEGARTKDNMVILDDFTTGEIAGQAFGFAPMRLVKRQELIAERKFVERRISKEKTDLLNAYSRAYFQGDAEVLQKVREKMVAFNKRHEKLFPEVVIRERTLQNSIKARKRTRKDRTHNGVRFSPFMKEYIDAQEKIEEKLLYPSK